MRCSRKINLQLVESLRGLAAHPAAVDVTRDASKKQRNHQTAELMWSRSKKKLSETRVAIHTISTNIGSNSGNFLSSGGFSAPGPGACCLLVGFFGNSGDFERSVVFRLCAMPRFAAGTDDGCGDDDGC